jgi:hypothetical protein
LLQRHLALKHKARVQRLSPWRTAQNISVSDFDSGTKEINESSEFQPNQDHQTHQQSENSDMNVEIPVGPNAGSMFENNSNQQLEVYPNGFTTPNLESIAAVSSAEVTHISPSANAPEGSASFDRMRAVDGFQIPQFGAAPQNMDWLFPMQPEFPGDVAETSPQGGWNSQSAPHSNSVSRLTYILL